MLIKFFTCGFVFFLHLKPEHFNLFKLSGKAKEKLLGAPMLSGSNFAKRKLIACGFFSVSKLSPSLCNFLLKEHQRNVSSQRPWQCALKVYINPAKRDITLKLNDHYVNFMTLRMINSHIYHLLFDKPLLGSFRKIYFNLFHLKASNSFPHKFVFKS